MVCAWSLSRNKQETLSGYGLFASDMEKSKERKENRNSKGQLPVKDSVSDVINLFDLGHSISSISLFGRRVIGTTLISMMWPPLICCLPDALLGFLVLPGEPASDDCWCFPNDRTHKSRVRGSVVGSRFFWHLSLFCATFNRIFFPPHFVTFPYLRKDGGQSLVFGMFFCSKQPTQASVIKCLTIAFHITRYQGNLLFPTKCN